MNKLVLLLFLGSIFSFSSCGGMSEEEKVQHQEKAEAEVNDLMEDFESSIMDDETTTEVKADDSIATDSVAASEGESVEEEVVEE